MIVLNLGSQLFDVISLSQSCVCLCHCLYVSFGWSAMSALYSDQMSQKSLTMSLTVKTLFFIPSEQMFRRIRFMNYFHSVLCFREEGFAWSCSRCRIDLCLCCNSLLL